MLTATSAPRATGKSTSSLQDSVPAGAVSVAAPPNVTARSVDASIDEAPVLLAIRTAVKVTGPLPKRFESFTLSLLPPAERCAICLTVWSLKRAGAGRGAPAGSSFSACGEALQVANVAKTTGGGIIVLPPPPPPPPHAARIRQSATGLHVPILASIDLRPGRST